MKYATEEAFVAANAFGKGAANTAYAQYFVGNSYLNPLTDPQVTALHLSNVTFEPGCRNNWHIHHAKSGGGQILICVAGRGFYQEWGRAAVELLPGDTVFCGGVYVAKNTSQSASLLEQKNQVRFRT